MKLIAVIGIQEDWNNFVLHQVGLTGVKYNVSMRRLIMPNDLVYIHITNEEQVQGREFFGVLCITSIVSVHHKNLIEQCMRQIR